MPRKPTGAALSPEFRTERARRAAAASNGAPGVITRFLKALAEGEFSDAQLDIVRRALPPVTVGTKAGE